MIREEDRPLAALVGTRARTRRVSMGATQEQIAEWCGLSPQVYSRMERGEVLPSLRSLFLISRALGTLPADLLNEVGTSVLEVRDSQPPEEAPPADTAEVFAIQHYARQLDPSTRGHVIALLKKLAAAPQSPLP